MTLKITTSQVAETSVTVNNNSPIQVFCPGSCMYVRNPFCVDLCSRLKQTARFDYKTFFFFHYNGEFVKLIMAMNR